VYEARTHGSVRGMMLDMIIQHHPTRLLGFIAPPDSLSIQRNLWSIHEVSQTGKHPVVSGRIAHRNWDSSIRFAHRTTIF